MNLNDHYQTVIYCQRANAPTVNKVTVASDLADPGSNPD